LSNRPARDSIAKQQLLISLHQGSGRSIRREIVKLDIAWCLPTTSTKPEKIEQAGLSTDRLPAQNRGRGLRDILRKTRSLQPIRVSQQDEKNISSAKSFSDFVEPLIARYGCHRA